MRPRHTAAVLVCGASLLAPASAALASYPAASHEQQAWVRRAAARFVAAELSGDGAGVCSVLDARLRGTEHHLTCAQRWDAKLAKLLRTRGGRARLRSQRRAIPAAAVTVRGNVAWIRLASPLMGGQNRFRWTENCWMLES
ncbi:MAG TPA: hypothetical protein VNZ01_13830 [Solirubrobacteraceae bacterium]|jgi:hypothetical protein|nr:hypothetical protein [Solirubrobacteraceae bacterium]